MAKRDYGNSFPSVTQVLGVLRKIGLEIWFKNNTAQFCNEKSKKGKEIGTQIHECIQNHIDKQEVKLETQYAEEVTNALNSFMRFKKEHPEIKLKKAEIQITSEKYGYNGTLDCLGNNGKLVLVDWKTGECKERSEPKIYPEHIDQACAYVKAYNEEKKTNIKKAYVVVLAKDAISYGIREIEEQEIDESFENVFLSALKVYNYQKQKGR